MGGLSLTPNPFNQSLFKVILIEVPDPAVSDDFTIPAPANHRSHLVGVSYSLTCDANVAHRYHSLLLQRAGVLYRLSSDQAGVEASHSQHCLFITGGVQHDTVNSLYPVMPLIDSPAFMEGDNLISYTTAMQAGDQMSNIQLFWHIQIHPQ